MPAPFKWLNDKTAFTSFGTTFTDPTISIRPGLEPIIGYTATSGTDLLVAITRDFDNIRNVTLGATTSSLAGDPVIDEQQISLGAFAGGLSVAVWAEKNDATGDFDIFAKTYFGETSELGPRFLVNVGVTAGNQTRPEVVTLGANKFAVTWLDATTSKVMFAIYDLHGDTIKAPTVLSTSNATHGFGTPNFRTSIIELDNGNFVVGYRADTGSEGKFRIMNSFGTFITAELDFDDVAIGSALTGLEALSDGRFLVFVNAVGSDLAGRFFNANGTPSGDVFPIDLGGTDIPKVTELKDGRLMLIATTTDFIKGQIIRADGTLDGAVFTINTTATGRGTTNCLYDIETLPDGRVMIVWNALVSGNDVIMETIFDPREAGLFGSASGFKDLWHGTDFSDVALMGDGDDSFFGYLGNDVVYGEAGDDILRGGDGADTFIGGLGNDTLEGDIGDDNLNGNLGNDTLRGGDGNDILQGEGGNDILEGGTGDDSVNGGTGNDTLKGGDGVDLLQGEAGDDNLQAGIGNDTLFGQGGIDTMFGEAGNDSMFGGDGNDTMFGQDDDDTMFGENGNDNMLGGSGNDTLVGQVGDDTLNGEAGVDFIFGGVGFDQLTGGTGGDNFFWDSFTQGADIVTDFSHAEGDKILLDHTAFGVPANWPLSLGFNFITGANAVSLQATATIVFDTATNILWYDIDGTGASGRQAIAFLTNGGGGITAGDIIFS